MKAIHNKSKQNQSGVPLFVNPKLKELFDKWKQFTTDEKKMAESVELFVNPKLKELFDKWKQFTTYKLSCF